MRQSTVKNLQKYIIIVV